MSENTRTTTANNTLSGDITPPLPGAVVEDWKRIQWVAPIHKQARSFRGPLRGSATGGDGQPVMVFIAGHQAADGDVSAEIWIGGDVSLATPDQARALAVDLLAIADDMEQLRARTCRSCHGDGYICDDPDGGAVRCFHDSGE
jgi:hypothetical protein